MKTLDTTIGVKPDGFVVHPPGEVHEYTNGPERTLMSRARMWQSRQRKRQRN